MAGKDLTIRRCMRAVSLFSRSFEVCCIPSERLESRFTRIFIPSTTIAEVIKSRASRREAAHRAIIPTG